MLTPSCGPVLQGDEVFVTGVEDYQISGVITAVKGRTIEWVPDASA